MYFNILLAGQIIDFDGLDLKIPLILAISTFMSSLNFKLS